MNLFSDKEIGDLLRASRFGGKISDDERRERKEYWEWLTSTPLADEQRLVIQFLTKIACWVLVRCRDNGNVFYGCEQMNGHLFSVSNETSNLFQPSVVLILLERAENRFPGVRGQLECMLQRHAADTQRCYILLLENAHKDDPQWLKETAIDFMRGALRLKKLKKKWTTEFLEWKKLEP